jgi:hypothetical protein
VWDVRRRRWPRSSRRHSNLIPCGGIGQRRDRGERRDRASAGIGASSRRAAGSGPAAGERWREHPTVDRCRSGVGRRPPYVAGTRHGPSRRSRRCDLHRRMRQKHTAAERRRACHVPARTAGRAGDA